MMNSSIPIVKKQRKTTLPNFLIVGMAKCGTSSLARYLQQHPEVFISKKKEPRFFTSSCQKVPKNGPKDHLVRKWYVDTFKAYKQLFRDAGQKAVGEASADTLYFYNETIPVIQHYLGDPKIIIILRDPVKRAFSAYQHLVRDEREFLSFEKALDLEESRRRENWELIYHYRSASRYYQPVKAFLKSFSNVKILLTKDLHTDPEGSIKSIFDFLEVSNSVRIDLKTKYNVSGVPRNKFLYDSIRGTNGLRNMVRPLARTFFRSERARSRVLNWLWMKNLDRMALAKETERRLYGDFYQDILQTEQLIGRDLSDWKQSGLSA